MSKTTDYTIEISNLSDILKDDKTLDVIKFASNAYYTLLRKNISKFSKSGSLLNSWKFEIYNQTEASIYSNLPYARIQDKGGKIPITSKMRNFAWRMYFKTKNKMWKAVAITKKKYVTMPAKEYSVVNFDKIKRLVEQNYGN